MKTNDNGHHFASCHVANSECPLPVIASATGGGKYFAKIIDIAI